jgi:hypothetical protein
MPRRRRGRGPDGGGKPGGRTPGGGRGPGSPGGSGHDAPGGPSGPGGRAIFSTPGAHNNPHVTGGGGSGRTPGGGPGTPGGGPGGPGDLGGRRPPHELTPERVEREYGIPRRNQRHFQDFADEENLVIDVRPTNPDSLPHLERGAIPKPQVIKPKSINDEDVLLGAKEEDKGKVGFFEPRMPPRGTMSDADYQALQARHDARVREQQEYGPTMEALAHESRGRNRFEVEDGVVYGYNDRGERHPVAGDHDLFDIRRADGSRLSHEEYMDVVGRMQDRGMGVEHAGVIDWGRKMTSEDHNLQAKMINEAMSEPGLVRFAPGQPPWNVYADTPVPP